MTLEQEKELLFWVKAICILLAIGLGFAIAKLFLLPIIYCLK